MKPVLHFLGIVLLALILSCQSTRRSDSYSSSGRNNSTLKDRKDSYASSSKEYSARSEKDSYSESGTSVSWMFWKTWVKKRRHRKDSYSESRKKKGIKKRKPAQGIKPY